MSLSEAIGKAQKESLDVVEVASKANPVVVKIIDFKKFKYEEAKKERQARRKTKEIWLGPLISDHDLETRLRQSEEFFSKGDRVKFTVKFTGRQMTHTELGFKLMEKVEEALTDRAEKDGEPRLLGRNLSLSFKSKR